MPFSRRAHNFFALCTTNPGKALGKCPPRAQARKMMKEGVKRKKISMPRKDKNGYY